ncbi:hypothetical protein K505DRAFT_343841 [Melanomma pulvis-pyrius CBS 109.77]|uniref:Uncharacterized protein n=1 Tax=Melanomma pulvis-pyrius CBS 109.77 TaxID=1314802 RepID=A0A6A6WQN3_9PLEO|nr:hypothetical protein K505DRAFT_343841 [Melanomma pulvis-pyrius CBS 109.77]
MCYDIRPIVYEPVYRKAEDSEAANVWLPCDLTRQKRGQEFRSYSFPISMNFCKMTLRHALYLLLLVSVVVAKFEHFYSGIADAGLQACIANSNFTRETVTQKENCREVFQCVLENTKESWQVILSSASAVLGFIPTVLLLLGNSNEDIIRVHTRFPLLALFLSITNVNKTINRFPMSSASSIQTSAPTSLSLRLGPYGVAGSFHDGRSLPRAKQIVMTLAHGVAAAGAACVIWQTVELAKKAVFCWACWTEFYPLLWICHGVLHHLLSVVCLRVSLGTEDVATSMSGQQVPVSKSRSVLFEPDLTLQSLHAVVKHEKFLRWSKVFLDMMNNVNYL